MNYLFAKRDYLLLHRQFYIIYITIKKQLFV